MDKGYKFIFRVPPHLEFNLRHKGFSQLTNGHFEWDMPHLTAFMGRRYLSEFIPTARDIKIIKLRDIKDSITH
jgi:hypothetical protein